MSQASTMTGGTKRIYHAGEKLQRSDKSVATATHKEATGPTLEGLVRQFLHLDSIEEK